MDVTEPITPLRWIQELESDRWRKGHGSLKPSDEGDAYCCLGVLCKLLGKTDAQLTDRGMWPDQDGEPGEPDHQAYPDWMLDIWIQRQGYPETMWDEDRGGYEAMDPENPRHRRILMNSILEDIAAENDQSTGYPVQYLRDKFL